VELPVLIRRSRIINLDLYLGRLASDRFYVLRDLDDAPEARLSAVGFSEKPEDGDTILPAAMGSVSRFNVEGRWIVHRDRPKESRYIRTTFRQWQTWDGEQHEDFKDIYRDCYPRELIEPASVQLTCRHPNGRSLVTSPLLINAPENRDHNKHVINLFLELFGSCVLAGEDLAVPPAIRTRQVNWRFLPPGHYPWDRLKDHLDKVLRATASGAHLVIMDRQETLTRYKPDELYVGEGGFADYIGYVFKSRGLVILESIQRDNALYVFGEDWERCSQMTKAEVINSGLHRERIIHTKGWKVRLHQILRYAETAE
jgi:hypothetical protein